MDKQRKGLSQDKVDAGRGIVKQPKSDKGLNNKEENTNDRPDDRARNAGY